MNWTTTLSESRRFGRLLTVFMALIMALPATAIAQDSTFGENDFVSPKFGTVIEWSDDWTVDGDNSSIQVRRDVLGLVHVNGDDAVLIELQSQRSFRSGQEYINASLQTYSRLTGFTIVEDNTALTPPSLEFTFQLSDPQVEVAGYIQSQPIEGATMVAIVLALPERLEIATEAANEQITVNGVPLLEALPVCGDESGDERPGDKTTDSTSRPGSKPDPLDDASPTTSRTQTTCIELFQSSGDAPRPTPTPEPEGGRGDSFDQTTWESTLFPGVQFSYERTAWQIDSEFEAADNFGRDGIVISHAVMPAFVSVEVFDGFNGRAGPCIDVALSESSISPGTDELLTDADGEPIQGSTQGRVWAAYAYTLNFEDEGQAEVGAYVECRALPGAKGVLVFTMLSPIDSFDEAYSAIQPVLRSIRLG